MSVYTTIADLQKAAAKENTGGGGTPFLTLKSGDNFRIRFRQEIAQDGSGYDEELGTAIVVPVHVLPGPGENFKKKLACTSEDEEFDFKCWAHEQIQRDNKWRAKPHFLTNVAVLQDGDWVNKVLDQSFSDKHVVTSLIEFASEYGSIVNRDYKISRTGSNMNDTQYRLTPLDPKPANDDIADLELHDLTKIYRKLPYEEQIEYFVGSEDSKPAAGSW